MNRHGTIVLIGILGTLIGCSEKEPAASGAASSSGQFNRVTMYPYYASKEQCSRIRNNWKLIEVGASAARVKELLGEPDQINPTYEPQIKNPRQIGYSYVYLLRALRGSGSVDEIQASLVRIHFDLDGRVARVDPVDVEQEIPLRTD
jgi:hypothetical protein